MSTAYHSQYGAHALTLTSSMRSCAAATLNAMTTG